MGATCPTIAIDAPAVSKGPSTNTATGPPSAVSVRRGPLTNAPDRSASPATTQNPSHPRSATRMPPAMALSAARRIQPPRARDAARGARKRWSARAAMSVTAAA